MALTANGIGSGLDIKGLVSQLMTVERAPLTALAAKEASFQARLSAFGQLKNVLSTLRTATNALNDATRFSATRSTVGADAGFTATSNSTASAGSYAIKVNQLATTQRVATSATSEFVPNAGELKIEFGTLTGGTFTADPDREKSLTFSGNTIEALRDAINGGDLGVKANIINNGSVKQLILTGTGTGASQAFRLSDGADGGVGLTFNPEVAGSASDPTYQVQAARSALLTVDGIDVARESNTISDVIDGVTLTLTKESSASASLSVADDRSGARSAIDAFVKAYNDVTTAIKGLTAYNPDTRQASTLTGDSTARSIDSQLRAIMGGAINGLPGANRLGELGITFKSDGILAVDSGKLDAALKDPAKNVSAFFAGNTSVQGFAGRLGNTLDGLLNANGLIAGRTEGINASVKSIAQQRAALSLRLDQTEKRYQAQFTALDSAVASMTQTSNYLAQQLANLPKINRD